MTADFASVAAPVFDHGGRPIAAISTTFRHICLAPKTDAASACGIDWPEVAAEVRRTAEELTLRIGGHR